MVAQASHRLGRVREEINAETNFAHSSIALCFLPCGRFKRTTENMHG